MQLFSHFAKYPWRVPLYCLPVAISGAGLEIANIFGDLGMFVVSLLVLLGLMLIVGLAGYVVSIRSLAKNPDASGVEVFFMVVLSIGHLVGTAWYWFVCGAMLMSIRIPN